MAACHHTVAATAGRHSLDGGAVPAGHGTAAGSGALFGPSASASTRAGGAPARGDGLEPGMRSSGPDIAAIVRAQLPRVFRTRIWQPMKN